MDNTSDRMAAPGYPIFLGSELTQPLPQQARFHLLPVPLEASVSYGGGTAQGPAAILDASWQLELWDGESNPADRGIYTHTPVDVSGESHQVIERIAAATRKILSCQGLPVALGGEHTATLGLIKGLLAAGITDLGVVQIDAHADLRDAYEGNPYSHASVMKRILDLGVPVFQLGVRALCEEELATRKKANIRYLDAQTLVTGNIHSVTLPEDFPRHLFFTLDIDGIDPSVFPATGTPVPGGLGWYQTLALFESVVRQRNLVGFDLMEFAPIDGFHAYQFSAALLVYKMMGIVERHG